MDIVEAFGNIEELLKIGQGNFDQRLRHTIEELGEVAKAYRNLGHTRAAKPTDHATQEVRHAMLAAERDALIEETVDTVICAMSLFCAADGEANHFSEIFYRKLAKWRRNIESKKD